MERETHLILKKMRKTCKISQGQIAKFLDVDQASISRLEKGSQGLQLDTLIKLSEFYNVKVEQIITGRINYYHLAQRFGITPKIKRRYLGKETIYFKECIPLFSFIKKIGGDKALENILTNLGIEDLIYLGPNQEVSTYIFLDVVKESMKQKVLSNRDIPHIINEGINPECLGSYYETFKHQKEPKNLLTAWFLASSTIERLFDYQILSQEKDSIIVESSLRDPSVVTEMKKLDLLNFFNSFKKSYFNLLLNHFNLTPVDLVIKNQTNSTSTLLEFSFV